MTAFAGTGAVFFGMATLSSVIKRDLSAMGKWLFIGAIMLFVGFANFFIQSSALMLTLLVSASASSLAFILYDLKRVMTATRPTTSRRRSASTWLFNVFQSLLALLGIFGGERE